MSSNARASGMPSSSAGKEVGDIVQTPNAPIKSWRYLGGGKWEPNDAVRFTATGPGGGNRIQGRYDPLDIRPRYPAGYTKAPCRTPAVPIGTTAIDSPSVPGAAGTLDIDTDVKFNGKPTTRLTITGTPTGAYAQVGTAADTYSLPPAAQEARERTVLCAVKHGGLGEPKLATIQIGSATMADYEAWAAQYVGDLPDGWSIYQKLTAVGPNQVVGAGASQDLSVPRRARLRVDTMANLTAGQMWFAEPYVLPPPTPTVIWTSDDGYDEWTWLAMEAQKRGLRLSFGIAELSIGQTGHLDHQGVAALQDQYGHEVTNHGQNNYSYNEIGLTEYVRRANSCRDYLVALGIDPRSARLHQYIQGVQDATLWAAMRDEGYLSARQISVSQPLFPSAGVHLVGRQADALYKVAPCVSLGSGITLDQVKTTITNTVKGGPAFIVGHRYEASANGPYTWIAGYDSQFGALDLMDWLAERRDVDGWRIMTWLEWYEDLFDSQVGVTV